MMINDEAMRARACNISDPAPWRREVLPIPWPTPGRNSAAEKTFSNYQQAERAAHPYHAPTLSHARALDRTAVPGTP
jgi:hypothetical protein